MDPQAAMLFCFLVLFCPSECDWSSSHLVRNAELKDQRPKHLPEVGDMVSVHVNNLVRLRAGIPAIRKVSAKKTFFLKCFYSGLEFSQRAGNLINRKITTFYIEAIPPKNLNSEKKIQPRNEKKIVSRLDFFFFGVEKFLGYSFDVKN